MRVRGSGECNEKGCTQQIVVLRERGGRLLPFDADLVPADCDPSQNGHVILRYLRPAPGRVLVPSCEVRDELLDGQPWRIMRHRCREVRGRWATPEHALSADLAEELFDILSGTGTNRG